MAIKGEKKCRVALWRCRVNIAQHMHTENTLLHFYTYVDALAALLQLK